jgi:hypothetical protein
MYDNIKKRDKRNTDVELFTQTVKSMNKDGSGTSSQEWFQSQVHGSMGLNSVPGDMFQPLETMIQDRLDTAIGLKQMSDVIRRMDEPAPRQLNGRVVPPEQPKKDHKEHFVTEGREAREITYRRAPEDILKLLDETFIMILFAYSVMPHIVGKNINSERMSGSNRMAEKSIERHDENVRQIARFVQMAMTEVSSEAVGDKDTHVHMEPCITTHTLTMIESVLTTEAAIEMNACVYNVPREFFDPARMKLKQMAMLVKPEAGGEGETEGDKTPNDARKVTKDRAPLTQNQKDSNMKAKTKQ